MPNRNKHSFKGAHLPDDLWNDFKAECKLRQVTAVQALAEAIKLWMSN